MKKIILVSFLSFIIATSLIQLKANSANPQFKKLYDIVFSQNVNKSSDIKMLEKAFDSNKPIVVEFYSDYCSTCKRIAPLLDSIMSDYNDRAEYFTINIDDNPGIVENFNISLIPKIYAINPLTDEMVEIPAHFILKKAKFKEYLDSVLDKFN